MKHAAAAAVPYSRDYKLKYENFRKQLAAQKPVRHLPILLIYFIFQF